MNIDLVLVHVNALIKRPKRTKKKSENNIRLLPDSESLYDRSIGP